MANFTLTILNAKGGSQKSTTTMSLAGCYAQRGLKVLIIDIDSQGNLANTFLTPEVVERLSLSETVAGLFDDKLNLGPDELVRETAFPNLFIVPANRILADYNHARPQAAGWLQDALRDFVAEVAERFDMILIDCPPALQLCTWAALVASDAVLVPVQCEDFGSQGLVHVLATLEQVRALRNPKLELLGFVLAMYDRRLTIHSLYEQNIRRLHGEKVFKEPIPYSTVFKEAAGLRSPVTIYKPRSRAARSIESLADEVMERIGRLRQPRKEREIA